VAAKRDFTDRFLKALKPAEPGKRYIVFDAQVPGFGIRVTERCGVGDKGSFVLVARFPGSDNPAPRRIGNYPALSLAKARQIAREWREDLRQGIDPKAKEAERQRQEQRRRADTFEAVFSSFADEHLSTLRTGKDVKRAVEAHVVPHFGRRPLTDIRRADVNELVRELRKSAPIRANRVLAYLKTFFVWAVDQELIEASPATAVKRPSKEVKRDRVLTDWEIRAIWLACGELSAFGRAFRFMLATGQRRSEVGDMTWSEVDRTHGLWTLSRERTKADRAHEVPLSELAQSIIDECPKIGDFVFSTGRSKRANGGEPAASVRISGWSKAKSALDKLALEKGCAIAFERGEDPPNAIADWHLHDLRRTAATYMARLGVERVVIGKVLNHAEAEVTAVYDRHRYDNEKRRALDLWGERLNTIVDSADSGKIVQLAAARGGS
jgi:integrase